MLARVDLRVFRRFAEEAWARQLRVGPQVGMPRQVVQVHLVRHGGIRLHGPVAVLRDRDRFAFAVVELSLDPQVAPVIPRDFAHDAAILVRQRLRQ
jgi:hypothetical protein